MNSLINRIVLITSLVSLYACSSGNITDAIPDRRPDYRQSRSGNALEVPPDLSKAAIDDQLLIPDLDPSAIASYSAYEVDQVKRDQRGYIEVLPPLNGVQVIENQGEIPYIIIAEDASIAWKNVKKYWMNNGIRIKFAEPTLGLMETDWLEDTSNLPKSGFANLFGLLSFLHDSGERDRYRIRFSRLAEQQTQIVLLHTKSEEVVQEDDIKGGRAQSEARIYTWKLSDQADPEKQLEMTRRLALFLSAQYRRDHNIDTQPTTKTQTTDITRAKLENLPDGTPALRIEGDYAQAWRVLAIGLDNAGYLLEGQDYQQGGYLVRYAPKTVESSKPGFFARLFSKKKKKQQEPESTQPQYAVRLADEGQYSIAIVQTPEGRPADIDEARKVLEAVAAQL